jgi:hypothetical protein
MPNDDEVNDADEQISNKMPFYKGTIGIDYPMHFFIPPCMFPLPWTVFAYKPKATNSKYKWNS